MAIVKAGTSISDFFNGQFLLNVTSETTAARLAPYVKEGVRLTSQGAPLIVEFSEVSSCWISFYFFTEDTIWGTTTGLITIGQKGVRELIRVDTTSAEVMSFKYRSGAGAFTEFALTSNVSGELYRLDIEINLANSGGALRLYINNTLIGELTGDTILTTENVATTSFIRFDGAPDFPYVISGVIVSDQDTRQMQLEQLSVTGAGTNSDFTGAFGAVDDIGIPNDADFINTSTLDDISTFALEDHDTDFNTGWDIEAVVVSARAIGQSDRFIRPALQSGAALGEGTGTRLELSHKPLSHIFAVDPATSTAWTPSAINSLEAGVKLASSA